MDTPEQKEQLHNVKQWEIAKRDLDDAKRYEMEQRQLVTQTLFPNAKKGTQRFGLGRFGTVKLVFGYNYTIGVKPGDERSKYDQVVELETRGRALGGSADVLIDRLIKWEPKISESEYNKLGDAGNVGLELKAIVDEYLDVKPASPQLSVEEPKNA